jgi:TonB family protein
MSLAPSATSGWTRRQWTRIILVGLLAHAVLVAWLGERAKPLGVVTAPDPFLKMTVEPGAIHEVIASPRLSDPTLFALPSTGGFSGGSWLRLAPAQPVRYEWTEPPRWLPLDTNELGAAFTRFVATNRRPGSAMEEILQPRITTADILVLNDVLMTQSVVSVEGPLAARPLAAPIRVSNPAHPDVLPETVVQLRVNPDGLTESVLLLEGCGVKSVDEQALTAARAARFQPQPPFPAGASQPSRPEPSWGRLVFHWLTVPHAN